MEVASFLGRHIMFPGRARPRQTGAGSGGIEDGPAARLRRHGKREFQVHYLGGRLNYQVEFVCLLRAVDVGEKSRLLFSAQQIRTRGKNMRGAKTIRYE